MTHHRQQKAVSHPSSLSIGKYAHFDEGGSLVDPVRMDATTPDGLQGKIQAARKQQKTAFSKTAEFWGGDALGGANIADSQNINYYSFEFPVDSMELPQSRAQELRFYRLAYDRDPIVGRGIDLHTEIPMSKISLERPKCSSEAFADYVYDFYQGIVNNTQLFQSWLEAAREYWAMGEAYLYVEDEVQDLCEAAQEFADNTAAGDVQGARATGNSRSYFESNNPAWGSEALSVQTFKTSSDELTQKIGFNPLRGTDAKLVKTASALQQVLKDIETLQKMGSVHKQADDPPAPPSEAPAPADATPDALPAGDDMPAPEDDGSGGGIVPDEEPDGMGSGPAASSAPMFGPMDSGGTGMDADTLDAPADPEVAKMKQVVQLLEKKKQLLKDLQDLHEMRANDYELFSHLTNKDYMGYDTIKLLPPEHVEITAGSVFGDGPTISYKPPEDAVAAYVNSESTPDDVRQHLQDTGTIPLNDDPLKGSYVIHFARKKAGYEDHGRSILQRCMRMIIYREKLRQVQTTLASRNMTPKTLIVAPGINASEMMALRGHVDEAKADPDYTVIVNYDCTWNEIGSEGRLLALDSEWQHTVNDLAVGLGFSPDILSGEGLYSNTRTQLEILSTVYLQFRNLVSYLIQEKIFKPIAMKKGFYELDIYGRPRWLYPTVNFGRMALRNTGETYQMLFDLYQKGSIPVSVLLELLDVDPEICRKKLEEDLFTVNDSKFNTFLEQFYGSLAGSEKLTKSTDVVDKLLKTLGLKAYTVEDAEIEGSGEGV